MERKGNGLREGRGRRLYISGRGPQASLVLSPRAPRPPSANPRPPLSRPLPRGWAWDTGPSTGTGLIGVSRRSLDGNRGCWPSTLGAFRCITATPLLSCSHRQWWRTGPFAQQETRDRATWLVRAVGPFFKGIDMHGR